jgi:hypothetical protein
METPIWAIGSTSKGRGAGAWEGDLQKCDYSIQRRVLMLQWFYTTIFKGENNSLFNF